MSPEEESDFYAPPVTEQREAEVPEREASDGPRGIGGWLLLPLLGLVLTPVRVTYSLITDYLPLFQNDWEVLRDESFVDYHPLWAPLLVYEVAGSVILAVIALVGLVLVFRRDRRFPKLMIALYALNLGYIASDLAVAAQIPGLAGNDQATQDLARAAVGAAIWIPYLLRSRRVRNTFVY